MSDDSEVDCNCPPEGLPAWMGTFADLMSLLMCFFVLLLSFAEMDAMKFRRLAGSLSQAFGVQSQIRAVEVPKGTSIIAQEFSPGRPEPTPINEIFQKTDEVEEMTLEVACSEEFEVESGEVSTEAGIQVKVQEQIEELIKQTEQDAIELAQALSEQIAKGEVEVETKGRQIVIRIREKGSFSSGSDRLQDDYIDVLHKVRDLLSSQEGKILVQGHTDNVPIKTARFRSNWDLSAARALSVAHELFSGNILDPMRFQVNGFAETRPLVENDSPENRARNRRVEIVIHQGISDDLKEDIRVLQQQDPEFIEKLNNSETPLFDLTPGEVF